MLTVFTNMLTWHGANPLRGMFPGFDNFLLRQHSSVGLAAILSVVALLPILLAVWVAASYLRAEPDEFVRTLLVRALLWGFTVTMAGDAISGVLTAIYGGPFPVGLLNADLFIAGTGIAFRLLARSYR